MDYSKALESAVLSSRHDPRSTWGQLRKIIEGNKYKTTDEILSMLFQGKEGGASLATRSTFLRNLVRQVRQGSLSGIDEELF